MPINQQRVRKLFDRVKALASDQRDRFLTEHCTDIEIRNAVLDLLNSETKPSQSGTRTRREPQPPNIPGYEILGRLGEGGMGVVYKAKKLDSGEVVAVKILTAANSADEDMRRRFEQEARTISTLDHERIVKIVDIGEFDGQPFIVLEYVDGLTLADKVGTPWEPKTAASFVKVLSHTVAAVHAKGIIHRDLKPANILIDKHKVNG